MDKRYKNRAREFSMVVPIYSSTHQNMVLDTDEGQVYLMAETEQDYEQLRREVKAELLVEGFSETEASKYLSGIKPLIRSQQPVPSNLELELVDTSDSIPTPRTPEEQEQIYQRYAEVCGVPVEDVKQCFDVLRKVLAKKKE